MDQQQETAAPKGIRLGGVDYEVIVDGTLEHDNYVQLVALHAGIVGEGSPALVAGVLVKTTPLAPQPGETEEQFATRLIAAAWESGEIFRLVASLLIPAGVPVTDWRESMAQEIADRLAKLTDLDDKKRFHALAGTILAVFFRSGVASSKASLNSSQKGSGAAPVDDQGWTAQQVDAMASGVC